MINILNKFTEDVIAIRLNGEIKFCNDKLLSKLRYEKSEVESKNLNELLRNNIIYEKILSYTDNFSLEELEFYIYSKDNERIVYKGTLYLDHWNEEKVIFIICKELKQEVYAENYLEDFKGNSYENSDRKLFSLNNGELIESYERLDKLQSDLVKSLNADGINVWIYYDDIEELISEFKSGICHEVVGDETKVKISCNEFYHTVLSDEFEGIKPISERPYFKMISNLINSGVKYQESYRISFNNKVLGILSIIYKDSKPDASKESFIKKICNEMGIIVQNQTLSNELRREFNRRVEREKELAEFLNIATDIMTVIDEDGNFIRINNEAASTLGWNINELKQMKWQDIVDTEYLEVTRESIEEAKVDPYSVKSVINKYKNKSKDLIWLDWRYKYFKHKKILVCTAKNITEEKKMGEQKMLYEKSLQLESIKNEFFSNISHEFKTPLNIILATMQLINKGIENKKISVTSEMDLKRYFNSVKQNSYRLLRLVNNLIDITKIESGYYNINLENNNIVSIVEDITMSVAQFIEDKGISLVFDTEVEDKIIACDPDKIERIMLNLLSNAIKYTKSNGEIDVTLSVKDDKVLISVKDDGIGIPKEKLETIFERFIQVDNQVTRKCQGSGIGLSLVKSLVELQGGIISVNSDEGKGTEFTFELPIRTIECDNEIKPSENAISSRIEKCNIEFSDIYS